MTNTVGAVNLKTIEDERLAYEKLIRAWGYAPKHNYLEVSKGFREPFQYLCQQGPLTRSLFNKMYLLLFTEQELILKEFEQDIVTRIPLEQVGNFSVRAVNFSILSNDCCISFSYKRKKYYFYLDIKEYPEEPRKYCRINFEMLLENKFYGLLQDEAE